MCHVLSNYPRENIIEIIRSVDIATIKEIFGKNSFIGYSCYISPSDTLTVEILLRYGPFFIELLVAISRIRSRAQTLAAVY